MRGWCGAGLGAQPGPMFGAQPPFRLISDGNGDGARLHSAWRVGGEIISLSTLPGIPS